MSLLIKHFSSEDTTFVVKDIMEKLLNSCIASLRTQSRLNEDTESNNSEMDDDHYNPQIDDDDSDALIIDVPPEETIVCPRCTLSAYELQQVKQIADSMSALRNTEYLEWSTKFSALEQKHNAANKQLHSLTKTNGRINQLENALLEKQREIMSYKKAILKLANTPSGPVPLDPPPTIQAKTDSGASNQPDSPEPILSRYSLASMDTWVPHLSDNSLKMSLKRIRSTSASSSLEDGQLTPEPKKKHKKKSAKKRNTSRGKKQTSRIPKAEREQNERNRKTVSDKQKPVKSKSLVNKGIGYDPYDQSPAELNRKRQWISKNGGKWNTDLTMQYQEQENATKNPSPVRFDSLDSKTPAIPKKIRPRQKMVRESIIVPPAVIQVSIPATLTDLVNRNIALMPAYENGISVSTPPPLTTFQKQITTLQYPVSVSRIRPQTLNSRYK